MMLFFGGGCFLWQTCANKDMRIMDCLLCAITSTHEEKDMEFDYGALR